MVSASTLIAGVPVAPISFAAAVTLLCGLIAFGQIRLRRIDGYQHLHAIIDQPEELAA